jgi:hypothetical protein
MGYNPLQKGGFCERLEKKKILRENWVYEINKPIIKFKKRKFINLSV